MANTSTDEKELMEWFDSLDRAAKWRISYYLIENERPAAETLRLLKAVDQQPAGVNLMRTNPRICH